MTKEPQGQGLRRIERGVERAIREAIERGEFKGLPGEGVPLPDDGAPDDERWAAMRVLRNAKAVPEWIELRREIDAERAALVRRTRHHLEWLEDRRRGLASLAAERILAAARATETRDAAFRRDLEERLAALNARVERHNALVPVRSLQLAPLRSRRLYALAREA